MKELIAIFMLLVGSIHLQGQQHRLSCQAYATLAAAQDTLLLEKIYRPLQKDFTARAIYAERLYALHTEQRDSILLDSLPKNGRELQDFYHSRDCGIQPTKPVAHVECISASFNNYFVDVSRAVVRHPEYMRQFADLYTQFNSTPVNNVDLSEQMCPVGVYVYLHRKTELLGAFSKANANPKTIPHRYSECP